MKGRTAKPTALKLLQGNPGHRPLPSGETQPAAAMPEVPDHLDDDAQKEWFRLIPELYRLGLMTELDRSALAAYCSAYSSWRGAEKEIQEINKQMPSAKGKNRARLYFEKNLAIGQRRNGLKEMNTFLAHFGLSPASRPRAQGVQQPDLPGMGFGAGEANESPLAKARRLAGG